MRKEDIHFTVIAIIVAHFAVSVFMALANGTSHPFNNMYVPGQPLPFIVAGCLLCVPLYMLMGFFFILGKMYLGSMKRVLRICCLGFMLVLLVCYATCFFLRYFNIIKGSWMYYVILNYPTGLLFNNISLTKDGLNIWFILTIIPGPLGFYLGSISRYNYQKSRAKREVTKA